MTISTYRNGVRTANTLMHSSWMVLVCVESRRESSVTIAVRACTLRANEKESGVIETPLPLSQGEGQGEGSGESRHPEPTPRHPSRPDTPTPRADPTPRHPDTPRKVLQMQTDARGCKGAQADARGCKGMQAIKQGERGKGQGVSRGGRGNSQKAQKAKH